MTSPNKNITESEKSYWDAIKSHDKSMSHNFNQVDYNDSFWKPFEKNEIYKYDLKFGDFFLYQIADKNGISYPKLAIFVKYMMCDQALELQYVDKPRTWMYNVKFLSNPELDIKMPVSERATEFSYHIEWDDIMFIFGQWSHQPTWKELRQAYERSIWFYKSQDWYREQQLKRLL